MVCCSPQALADARAALEFTVAALQRGCTVVRVFFYHEGVYTGLATAQSPAGEYDPRRRWLELARDHGLDLVLCVGAAQRRGILDQALATQSEQSVTLAEGFRIAGLGAWLDAVLAADRVIRFET